MSSSLDSEWFAIQTKPGAEEIAAQTVSTLDLEIFLPLSRRPRLSSQRSTARLRPLFPSYFFARFQPQLHLHSIRYSRGVLRVIGGRDKPWPVEESLITEIRDRLNNEGWVELQPTRFQPGERVRICDGPLSGWCGIFDGELDDQARVTILLESMRQARVALDRGNLELADAV